MTCFAVIGLPRSGTTVVAEILHKLGVSMGEKWSSTNGLDAQPGESYIDADLNEIHQNLMGPSKPMYGMEVDSRYLDLYGRVLRERCQQENWGIKCHCLPFLWPIFVDRCTQVIKVIKTWRHPAEILASSATQFRMTPELAREECFRWIDPIARVWSMYRGSRLEVRFSDLIHKPSQLVNDIAEFAGVPFNREAVLAVKPAWKRF